MRSVRSTLYGLLNQQTPSIDKNHAKEKESLVLIQPFKQRGSAILIRFFLLDETGMTRLVNNQKALVLNRYHLKELFGGLGVVDLVVVSIRYRTSH
jgi:hypothetical protein